MNYLQSVAYLESLSPSSTPKFERMQTFMAEFGNVQDELLSLHVGGTNGKGSTTAILDSILRSAGLKVGRFTGPHLLRWNERFHIDGRPIGDGQFAELATRLRRFSEEFAVRHPEFGPLTWFEFLTAMAFLYFIENRVDIAVFEVGLGGRFDATNVLSMPCATAITNVDLDHTHILGGTVREIASEKAGIIKFGVPVVTASTGDAFDEIIKAAWKKSAPVIKCVSPDLVLSDPAVQFPWFNNALEQLALLGSHQRENALVALACLHVANMDLRFAAKLHGKADIFDPEIIRSGFANVYWPGRLQYLQSENLILDGAHNPAGAKALRAALDELIPDKGRIFVLGSFANKDVKGFIANLLGPNDKVVATEVAHRRAVTRAEHIADCVREVGCVVYSVKDVGLALQTALSSRTENEVVIATGSLITVKESMLALGWRTVEDGLSATQSNRLLSASH